MVLLKVLVIQIPISGYYLMKLYLKAFVILKLKQIILVEDMILLEFAPKKDQIEMVPIKMVGQYDLEVKMIILILLAPSIIIRTNYFLMIGKQMIQ
jgi:hypothetical protein